MGIHVARYSADSGPPRWAHATEAGLLPIEGDFETLADFLANGRHVTPDSSATPIPIDQADLLSPVTAPCNLVCQGLNYGSHREETGSSERSAFNMLFVKAWSSLCGPTDDVVRPPGVRLLDYELELGLVIGTEVAGPVQVTRDNLSDYVAGLVICNDVSARDVQIPQGQWFKGKSYRTFCPAGPLLYLLDPSDPLDTARIDQIDIQLEVNGELRQKANTSQLLYGPAETLTEVSGLMDLAPGDVLLTGTPGGVALGAPSKLQQRIGRILMSEEKLFETFIQRQANNPNYLKDGDVMRLTMRSTDGVIDLGVQQNRIVSAGKSGGAA